MKRQNEHDAHRSLKEGKRSKYRPPAPKNPIPATVVLGWIIAVVVLVVVLTPIVQEAMR